MKKLAVIILTVIGVALGTNFAASAAEGYPPGTTVTITPPTTPPTPGSKFDVVVNNVKPGETVTIVLDGKTYTGTAGPTGGAVKIQLTAPSSPGAYVIEATVGTGSGAATVTPVAVNVVAATTTTAPTGATTTVVGATTTTVSTGATTTTVKPATTLAPTTTVKPVSTVPVTGSNTPFTGMAIGIPLLVGGLVLLVVSRRRRPVGA